MKNKNFKFAVITDPHLEEFSVENAISRFDKSLSLIADLGVQFAGKKKDSPGGLPFLKSF